LIIGPSDGEQISESVAGTVPNSAGWRSYIRRPVDKLC